MQDDCRAPLQPPPSFVPQHSAALHGTGPEFIRQQLFLYTHVLTGSGEAFWSYPIRCDEHFVYAYVWKDDAWRFAKLPLASINCVF